MKAPLFSLAASLLLISSMQADVNPRTIATKDGHTYKDATITQIDPDGSIRFNSAKSTYHVALKNLPDDLQSEVKTILANRARLAAPQFLPNQEKVKFKKLNPDYYPAGSEEKVNAFNTLADKCNATKDTGQLLENEKQLSDLLNALKDQRKAEADSFYKQSEADILRRFGPPIGGKNEGSNNLIGDFRILSYSQGDAPKTYFIIRDDLDTVQRGFYDGLTITEPRQPAETNAAHDPVVVTVQTDKPLLAQALKKHAYPIIVTVSNNTDEKATITDLTPGHDFTVYALTESDERKAILPGLSSTVSSGIFNIISIHPGESVSIKESVPENLLDAKYKAYVVSAKVGSGNLKKSEEVFSAPFSMSLSAPGEN